MKSKIEHVISTLIVIMMIMPMILPIISYSADNINGQLENQGLSTNNDNVQFDIYYDDNTHSNISDINSVDTKINIKINVKKAGYLKEAVVSFTDANFEVLNNASNQEEIQSIDTVNNKVIFNQINSGASIIASITIKAKTGENVKSDLFNKDIIVNLDGKYVASNSKEVLINGSKTINKQWNGSSKTLITQTLQKYIPYNIQNETGVMLQSKITTKIDNNNLPIKGEELQIETAQLKNEKPKQVIVVANSTNGTNGEKIAQSFNSTNWNYDENTGIVKINIENKADENGNISWAKNAEDEYLITCIYSENVYKAVNGLEVEVLQKASSTIIPYNNVETKNSENASINEKVKVALGNFVDFNTTISSQINKGYMYNNKIASDENKKETDYQVEYSADISYAKLLDKITFTRK